MNGGTEASVIQLTLKVMFVLTTTVWTLGFGPLAVRVTAVDSHSTDVSTGNQARIGEGEIKNAEPAKRTMVDSKPLDDVGNVEHKAGDGVSRDVAKTKPPASQGEKIRQQLPEGGREKDARIQMVIPNIQGIEDDLKWLIELSPTAELKAQWKTLKSEVFEALIQGEDLTRPVELDFVFRRNEMSYEFRLPISKFADRDGFLDWIKGIGFRVRLLVEGTFYELFEQGKRPYYLRYDGDYAWTSREKDAIPLRLPDATVHMASLLDMRMDIAFELKNEVTGIASRRVSVHEFCKSVESSNTRMRNEKESDYRLRKLRLGQRLDEIERILVETDTLQIGWTTSSSPLAPFGRGRFTLIPLPGTDLQKSVAGFATNSSHFANVALHTYPLLIGKVNFPLDPPRVAHLREFWKAVRPKDDSNDDAANQSMRALYDLIDATVSLGVVDGFVDAHSNGSSENSVVCGIRTANGKAVDEILGLLPHMATDWQVKLNYSDHDGVGIHAVTVPSSRFQAFRHLFVKETVLYVGTDRQTVWCAAGVDALSQLKTAIDQTSQPPPVNVDPVVVSYPINVLELMTLVEHLIAETTLENPRWKEQIMRTNDVVKCCRLARQSMDGCSPRIWGELRRTEDRVEGFVQLNDCVMNFVGAMIANGIKELVQ